MTGLAQDTEIFQRLTSILRWHNYFVIAPGFKILGLKSISGNCGKGRAAGGATFVKPCHIKDSDTV
jgi:hypothetical protein